MLEILPFISYNKREVKPSKITQKDQREYGVKQIHNKKNNPSIYKKNLDGENLSLISSPLRLPLEDGHSILEHMNEFESFFTLQMVVGKLGTRS